MNSVWPRRVQAARSADDLLRIAREYVAAWPPSELSNLPEDLRPPAMGDPDALAAYALDLVQKRCSDPDSASPELTRMTRFFATAAHRMSQILATSRARM